MEQLGELVVANERLAGRPVSKARQTVEFLKRKREVWQQIYAHVVKQDANATLAALEEAHKQKGEGRWVMVQVAEAMTEEWRERQSVGELRRQLLLLQDQVATAHHQLHHTQDLVQLNRERIQQLTADAQSAQAASAAGPACEAAEVQQALPVPRILPFKQPAVRSCWMPVAFSESVGRGMTKLQHAGQPWILFRDAQGAVACIEDCCAHRACPLSLGKVENGSPTCAYHGWKYNGQGECVEMPSTAMSHGIRVNSLACTEREGFIWITDPALAAQEPQPASSYPLPEGYRAVSRLQMDACVGAEELEGHIMREGALATCPDAAGWRQGSPAGLFLPRASSGQRFTRLVNRGWVACISGINVMEVHTMFSAKPGQCRWLYQLCIKESHWSCHLVPQRLWQLHAQQVMKAQLHVLESKAAPEQNVLPEVIPTN